MKLRFGCYALASMMLWACGQDYNSNSGDDKIAAARSEAIDCAGPARAHLCAARAILQTRCFSCHTEWHPHRTDAQWVASGLVIPGDNGNSRLITRLINSGSDMPRGGSALPADEYAALNEWIKQLSLNLGEVPR